jgi:flagellar basal-body rod protein FlgF
MIKSIHTAGSGMVPMMTKLEVIANNLANMNTTGFKGDGVFMKLVKDAALKNAQSDGNYAETQVEPTTDFTNGSLEPTNNPLDVAVEGSGFFVVDTAGGQRFTRNGNFTMTPDGTLVTQQGHPVEGINGRIQIPDPQNLAHAQIVVTEAGEVVVDNKQIGRLRIVDVEDPRVLKKEDSSMFVAPVGTPVQEMREENTRIRQGYLEGSNVNGLEEMIAMVELVRNFESNQRVVQTQDSTLDKTNDVGRF